MSSQAAVYNRLVRVKGWCSLFLDATGPETLFRKESWVECMNISALSATTCYPITCDVDPLRGC